MSDENLDDKTKIQLKKTQESLDKKDEEQVAEMVFGEIPETVDEQYPASSNSKLTQSVDDIDFEDDTKPLFLDESSDSEDTQN